MDIGSNPETQPVFGLLQNLTIKEKSVCAEIAAFNFYQFTVTSKKPKCPKTRFSGIPRNCSNPHVRPEDQGQAQSKSARKVWTVAGLVIPPPPTIKGN